MSREKTRVSLARKIIGAILLMQVVVMTCLSIMVVYGITQNVSTTATEKYCNQQSADNRTGEKPDCGKLCTGIRGDSVSIQ